MCVLLLLVGLDLGKTLTHSLEHVLGGLYGLLCSLVRFNDSLDCVLSHGSSCCVVVDVHGNGRMLIQ